jgi:hypothetical protein
MYRILLVFISFSFCVDVSYFAKILESVVESKRYEFNGIKFTQTYVDYAKLKGDLYHQTLINQQIKVYAKAKPPAKKQAKLSFWINAYNFFTLVDAQSRYPLKSMIDLGWKKKNHTVNGKKLSLDEIEHKYIRPLGDPKIHFAINCASVGCANLRKKPYNPKRLQFQLRLAVKNTLKNPLHLRPHEGGINKAKGVTATKLFEWYESDFENVESFIGKYGPRGSKGQKVYLDIEFDWRINTKKNVLSAFSELERQLPNLKAR